MTKEPKDIKEIFSEAIEKQTAEKRAAYLDEACGNDTDLRSKVEALLKANKEAGDFLEVPDFDPTVTMGDPPLTEGPGTIIGRYKLLEKIGEGGMATIYMSEQRKPIRRKIALKIIKLGMDTKEVIARFEAERQALAMMNHPNIARVLDAGATETGRPYFVMELVKGISITEYCDKNKLSTRERLELFIQVCNAVQHAHQKGIIHRDIKPSNVMITLHDGKPVPKVIDFGIAKATSQRLTEKTLFTRYAQMIGTPEYMSPEQAEMSGLDVDTRSDIYSLGVLLYKLLTGTTPFDADELHKAGYNEMQRIIREEEPTKPSTKLSTLGDTLTAVAEHRRTNPVLLRKLLKGDLDWIVMKSIEKDRIRRYESVDALAADVQRHLNHEPVLAGSPGLAYRLKKFVLKHRTPLAATAGIIVVVSIGLIFAIMFIRAEAKRQRDKKAITTKIVDRELLWEAQKLYDQGRYRRGLSKVAAILGSETVGAKARLLYARLLRPEPADGADVGVKPQVRLGWADGLDVASYKVYFGTFPDDLALLCQVQEDCYAKSPRLQSHKWYCWRVDAVRFDGSVIEGEPYSFSTGNMIAWWKFDQAESHGVTDSSGNTLHGKLLADAHIITDPLRGNVLSLDGSRDCVRFGTDDKFNITGQIDYLTPAMNPSNEGDKSKFVGVLPDMSKLVDGTNVLAVEIHRAQGGSSDSGLSLSLTGATKINKLIPWGSTWKYLDDGSDQGTAWYDPGFDDSSWASGPAELGHEHDEELEATVISWGTDDNERRHERHVTHYFRHSFNVSDASNYQGMHLEIERDDGAVVYLNGKEVFRDNMPDGTITYMTRALYTVSSGDFFCSSFFDAGNLVDGTNVLAVEIHQRLGGSGDISFDLNLAGLTDFGTLVSSDAVWKYRNDDSDQGAPWYSGGFDDSGWARGSMKLSYGAAGYKNDTTYFRHSFKVPDASIYKALGLGITSDDGTVIYLNGTEIATTNMQCGSMTVAMWVKAKSFDKRYHTVISKGEAWNLNLLNMKEGTALFNFTYTGVIDSGSYRKNAITANATIESGNWYHFTAVYDGTRMHLYVNGRLDNSGRAFGAIVDNEYPVVVGENWENVYHEFNGLIDDVRIYRYALSKDEVEALCAGHGPGPVERPRWVVNIAQ